MYGSGGSKKTVERPVASTRYTLPFGDVADEQAAVGRRRQCVDLQFVGVEEHAAAAGGIHEQHLAVVARADERAAVGTRRERPEKRRVGVVDRRRHRAERQPAVGIDRQTLDVAAQEVGLGRDLPERGQRRAAHGGRGVKGR